MKAVGTLSSEIKMGDLLSANLCKYFRRKYTQEDCNMTLGLHTTIQRQRGRKNNSTETKLFFSTGCFVKSH